MRRAPPGGSSPRSRGPLSLLLPLAARRAVEPVRASTRGRGGALRGGDTPPRLERSGGGGGWGAAAVRIAKNPYIAPGGVPRAPPRVSARSRLSALMKGI